MVDATDKKSCVSPGLIPETRVGFPRRLWPVRGHSVVLLRRVAPNTFLTQSKSGRRCRAVPALCAGAHRPASATGGVRVHEAVQLAGELPRFAAAALVSEYSLGLPG